MILSPFIKKTLLIAGGLAVLILLLLLGLNRLNQDRVILGTVVAGTSYGGIRFEEAEQKLNQSVDAYLDSPVEIVLGQKKVFVKPLFLGLGLDTLPSFEALKSAGHTGSWAKKTGLQLKSLFLKNEITLTLTLDQEKFHAWLSGLTAQEIQPQDAQIKFDFGIKKAYLEPSRTGKVFDRETLLAVFFSDIPRLRPARLDLQLADKAPVIDNYQTTAALELTNKIISLAPISLGFDQKSWQYDANDVFGWLDFRLVDQENLKITQALWAKIVPLAIPDRDSGNAEEKILFPDLNEDAITATLAQLVPAINQEPRNARLQVSENDNAVTASASRVGRELDIDASLKIVKKNLYAGSSKIALVVREVKPRIDSWSLSNLGLVSLLSTGVSDFSGSPTNRKYNIKIGAAKFDGILLPPNEEFSFNSLLGDVDAASGYLPELVIKDNKTIPEYGGGLCQVSTTLFRAAVNAGFPILERSPHAYPVAYYNPQGFDSTIYPPHPDLRFKNDTPNNILLQSYIKGNKLFFEVFGTSDGRETKIKGPFVLEANPDGSMKTILTQEVWKNEKSIRTQVFRSNYKSPALYHKNDKNPLE